jgi:hypothetical protein
MLNILDLIEVCILSFMNRLFFIFLNMIRFVSMEVDLNQYLPKINNNQK